MSDCGWLIWSKIWYPIILIRRMRAVMLSKCANPKCSNLFHYLHEGKLYRLDVSTGRIGAYADYKEPGSHVEFFWLCDDCAADMTVVFTGGKGVEVKLFRRMRREAS